MKTSPLMDMKDRDGNPLEPAIYRGERVYVDTSVLLLSLPPQRRIVYEDGRTGYANRDALQFLHEGTSYIPDSDLDYHG